MGYQAAIESAMTGPMRAHVNMHTTCSVLDAVVGAVEVVDGTVVEVLAAVVVIEWLTVDVGAAVGDPPQENQAQSQGSEYGNRGSSSDHPAFVSGAVTLAL
jgi:hypothetical protein